jgi:hypothetical protein
VVGLVAVGADVDGRDRVGAELVGEVERRPVGKRRQRAAVDDRLTAQPAGLEADASGAVAGVLPVDVGARTVVGGTLSVATGVLSVAVQAAARVG